VFNVFCLCFREYKDVVEVRDNKFVEVSFQYFKDESLKRCWCVGESERYNVVFKVSELGSECRFLFVPFLDPESIVCVGDVVFAEIFRSLDNVLNFVDQRQRVPVLDSNIVELSVINVYSEFPSLLGYEQDRISC
jgi:hypothetical protein